MSQVGMLEEASATVPRGSAFTEIAREPAGQFPAGFVWGTATASFQIEGARTSRGDSIWDRFCAQPGAILDGSNGDHACDHVNRWRDDVELLRQLGVSALPLLDLVGRACCPRVVVRCRRRVSTSTPDSSTVCSTRASRRT